MRGFIPAINVHRIAITAFFCAIFAFAHASSSRAVGDRIYLNGVLVITLKYGNSDAITNRAQSIATRLRNLSQSSNLTLKSNPKTAEIVNGEDTILTITPDEAKEHQQDPKELATEWLARINKALTLPPIKIEKDSLRLPVGVTAKLDLTGSEADQSSIDLSNPDIVEATRDGYALNIKSKAIGRTTVTVQSPTGSDKLEVAVLPYAAELNETLTAEVTGDPATSETVKGAIEGAIRIKLKSRPGATIEYTAPQPGAINQEDSQNYKVDIHVIAPECFPAEGPLNVRVQNSAHAFRAESELWYCNEPEDLRAERTLFVAHLKTGSPARLLYHHRNVSQSPLVVRIRAINHSPQEARIVVIPGDSAPDSNPVLAGYKAGDQFFRNWMQFSGEVVTIPANSEMPLSVRKASPGQTVSGLCYLSLLGGPESLLVKADVKDPESIAPIYAAGFNSSTPWRILGFPAATEEQYGMRVSNEVYPSPFSTEEVLYRVGGRFGFVRIGEKPIENDQGKLEGNFGVVYTIKARLENPTLQPADIEVIFESSAGYSGGLFVVNGRMVRTPLLQPKEEAQITRVHLGPGENESLRILTFPLSGGSYPATLTIRPVGH